MKICLINGTPKFKDSASMVLMNDFKPYLAPNEIVEIEAHRNALSESQITMIRECNALVFFFPLYVDGIPSHLLSCLSQLEILFILQPQPIHVYAVCNNGFYDGSQNYLALKIMELWCKRCELTWGQGIGFGGGGMIQAVAKVSPGKGPKKNLGKAYEQLSDNILNQRSAENILTNANFPRFLYKMMAEMGWRRQAKKNGLHKGELGKPY